MHWLILALPASKWVMRIKLTFKMASVTFPLNEILIFNSTIDEGPDLEFTFKWKRMRVPPWKISINMVLRGDNQKSTLTCTCNDNAHKNSKPGNVFFCFYTLCKSAKQLSLFLCVFQLWLAAQLGSDELIRLNLLDEVWILYSWVVRMKSYKRWPSN